MQLTFCSAQNCDNNFDKKEYDPINKVKTIITKYQTLKGTNSNKYTLRFQLQDKMIDILLTSPGDTSLERESEISFLFGNHSALLIKLSLHWK